MTGVQKYFLRNKPINEWGTSSINPKWRLTSSIRLSCLLHLHILLSSDVQHIFPFLKGTGWPDSPCQCILISYCSVFSDKPSWESLSQQNHIWNTHPIGWPPWRKACSFKIIAYEINLQSAKGQLEAVLNPEVLSFWFLHCPPYWAHCSI